MCEKGKEYLLAQIIWDLYKWREYLRTWSLNILLKVLLTILDGLGQISVY